MLVLLLVPAGFGVRQDPPVSKLLHACIDNRKADVMSALDEGASVDEQDEDGSTCLAIAERMGYAELSLLLKGVSS